MSLLRTAVGSVMMIANVHSAPDEDTLSDFNSLDAGYMNPLGDRGIIANID